MARRTRMFLMRGVAGRTSWGAGTGSRPKSNFRKIYHRSDGDLQISCFTLDCARIGPSDESTNLPKIGIGGSLAAPPLPHHRTYGSVYGGSRSCANALRSRTGARAIWSGHWKARWRGLCSGRDARGHGRCRPCSTVPLRLAARSAQHGGDAVFSTDAIERPAVATGPSE